MATITTRQGRTRARSMVKHTFVIAALTVIILLWSTGCMEHLFYQPTVGPTPASLSLLAGTEDVTFASGDGTRLHGWFIPADGITDPSTRKMHPTILYVHGNAGDLPDHLYFCEYLPPAGFNVFMFDYRGYGASEGKATARGPLIADANAALQYLLTRKDVDPERIGIMGQSLGGAIAINVAAEHPDLVRAGVFQSAFASWRAEAAYVVSGDPPAFWARWLAAILIPDSDRPVDAIGRITCPILIIHGDADTIVPVRCTATLQQAAAAPESKAQVIILKGAHHNDVRDVCPEVDGEVIGFLRQCLRQE